MKADSSNTTQLLSCFLVFYFYFNPKLQSTTTKWYFVFVYYTCVYLLFFPFAVLLTHSLASTNITFLLFYFRFYFVLSIGKGHNNTIYFCFFFFFTDASSCSFTTFVVGISFLGHKQQQTPLAVRQKNNKTFTTFFIFVYVVFVAAVS